MADQEIADTRENFRDLLTLISDAEAQIHYERTVPIANVPAELVCMWFDDNYHPESDWFPQCFSAKEQEILADFHDFYDERVGALPDGGAVEQLHKLREWQEIMAKARTAVKAIDWSV